MRCYSSLTLVLLLVIAIPGCAGRRSRATGSLYPATGLVAVAPNPGSATDHFSPSSPAALSDYVQAVLKISSENTAAAEQALKQLHDRRPELAKLSSRAAANRRDVETRRALAEAYLEEGLPPYAFQMYQEIQSIKPDDSRAELGIARVWDIWGDYGLAHQHAQRAVLLEPGSAEAFEVLGRIQLHRNDLDQALSAFLSAVKVKPQNASLLANAGYVFLKRGDLLQARLYFEQALAVDGSLVEARNNLGIALARMGERSRALQEFMAVNDPAAAFNNLGVVYLGQKQWRDARDAFLRALALDRGHSKAKANLAEAEAHIPLPSVIDLPRLNDRDSVATTTKASKLALAASKPVGTVTKKDSRLLVAYRDALGRFRARRYREAIDIFQWLLGQEANHTLSSNCEYWIGESYFGLADYGRAYASFKRVTGYANSTKRNDALLMMRRASLKQRRNSRTT
jgi:Tfp pilus assembly protein PilF